MKNLSILILSVAAVLSFTQCNNSSADKLCSNVDTRAKIITELMNNDAYMNQVMDSMQTKHADAIVSTTFDMMKMDQATGMQFMNGVMSMCEGDTTMFKMMMGKTMEMCDTDKGKCSMVMGSMKEHPIGMRSMMDMGMCNMEGMNMEQEKDEHSHPQ